ncbi:MAG: metalloregulator ArsR/SmtB family transcription factor [Raoultibacter sp.]
MGEADYALLFKALSDANRVKIVKMISEQNELCACKILDELGITQPTLSHHMKVLCSCNLVKCRKEGKWIHYSLNRKTVVEVRSFIDSL